MEGKTTLSIRSPPPRGRRCAPQLLKDPPALVVAQRHRWAHTLHLGTPPWGCGEGDHAARRAIPGGCGGHCCVQTSCAPKGACAIARSPGDSAERQWISKEWPGGRWLGHGAPPPSSRLSSGSRLVPAHRAGGCGSEAAPPFFLSLPVTPLHLLPPCAAAHHAVVGPGS